MAAPRRERERVVETPSGNIISRVELIVDIAHYPDDPGGLTVLDAGSLSGVHRAAAEGTWRWLSSGRPDAASAPSVVLAGAERGHAAMGLFAGLRASEARRVIFGAGDPDLSTELMDLHSAAGTAFELAFYFDRRRPRRHGGVPTPRSVVECAIKPEEARASWPGADADSASAISRVMEIREEFGARLCDTLALPFAFLESAPRGSDLWDGPAPGHADPVGLRGRVLVLDYSALGPAASGMINALVKARCLAENWSRRRARDEEGRPRG